MADSDSSPPAKRQVNVLLTADMAERLERFASETSMPNLTSAARALLEVSLADAERNQAWIASAHRTAMNTLLHEFQLHAAAMFSKYGGR